MRAVTLDQKVTEERRAAEEFGVKAKALSFRFKAKQMSLWNLKL